MTWESFLGFSALVLSVVNGLMLLRSYLRDRPVLVVEPIHPDTYQWFFNLPGGVYQGRPTRKYGFLVYIGIANKGVRDVALKSWRLFLKTGAGKWIELRAISIPEPQIKLGESEYLKAWPVLGQKGVYFSGDTVVKSGHSIAGFVYYTAEFYGSDAWNPSVENGKAISRLEVRGVYGNTAGARVTLSQIPLEQATKMIPGIDKVDSASSTPSSP